jgi:hypothetical protein
MPQYFGADANPWALPIVSPGGARKLHYKVKFKPSKTNLLIVLWYSV